MGIIFTLKVSLDKKIYRVIEIKGDSSLEDLAECIISAFNFNMDHCFGFYDNVEDYYSSDEKYELFVDMEDCDPNDGAKSVKQTHVFEVFSPNRTLAFVFDYGDEWLFTVECTNEKELILEKDYPLIIKSVGKAPEQYASEHDEDEEE